MIVSACDVLLEVLRTEGVRHIFGNPGSTELPLIDALATVDDMEYVLGLQEAVAVGMADGYAQVTGRPAFVNLHTSAGLGNAIGNLTNAQSNRTPLVITAGQQDFRHIEADPVLSGDLVGLARPVAKWSHEVRTGRELGTIMRRAFKDAPTEPRGPVFVSLPMSILEEEGAFVVPPRSAIDLASVAAELSEVAESLAGTPVGELVIVAGDEVAAGGAVASLVALAEMLGAPVFASPLHGSGVFPPEHPLFMGALPASAAAIRSKLAEYARILFVGGQAFRVYPYSEGSPVPDGCELIHLSPDPAQIGRIHPAALGRAGALDISLVGLAELLAPLVNRDESHRSLQAAGSRRRAEIDRLERSASERYDSQPLHPMAAAHAVLRAMPSDAAVVDEAITTGTYVRGFHHWTSPDRYFFCRGGGLGWGMPAALGVSLGLGGSVPVLAAIGDGSAMYSPQALWTAARMRLPVVFAIFVNRQYLILKNNLIGMKGRAASTGRFVGLDIDDPPVDYVALAASMGVTGTRAATPDEVSAAIEAALASGAPHLVEIPIGS